MGLLKLDLHVHTIFSGDSLIKPAQLLAQARRKGLDGFAITDHDSMKAYRILKEKNDEKELIIIPGMEIETHIGEVMGLFLKEEIDVTDNSFFTVVHKIKDQGGLVVIPHPFDFLRDNHLKMSLLNDKIVDKYIDGIEIMNSRTVFSHCVKKARTYQKTHDLFETGGSDAHTIKEIGNGYTVLKGMTEPTLEQVKEALLSHHSESKGKLSSPFVHLITVMNKLKKGLYF